MTYARARLWNGACAVALLFLLSLIAWLWQIPATLFPFDGGPVVTEWAAFVTLYAIYALLMFPFDLLGGYWIPFQHGRRPPAFPRFVLAWLRGVGVHAAVTTLSALALFLVARRWGVWAAAGLLVALQSLLLIVALPLARLTAGLRDAGFLPPVNRRRAVLVSAASPAFAGGFTGLPGREAHVIPVQWQRALAPDQFNALVLRRDGVLQTGARLRGVLLAMAWNTVGFVLVANLPGAGVERLWEFVTTLIAFTFWSFLGLLVLPALSRGAVLEADRYAVAQGADPATLLDAAAAVDRWQGADPRRGRWNERLFHPVPSLENRRTALQSGQRSSGGWHASRLALYLSWANFGLLSRAAHSSAGKPELWIFPPGD